MKNKKRLIVIVIALAGICIVFLLGKHLLDRKLESIFRKINLNTVERKKHGYISYKLKWGRIFVSVIDKYGDGHSFILCHPGVSKSQAIKTIQEKSTELEKKKYLKSKPEK